jgi:GNAT superfamily N-acetyltransferase
VTRPADPDFIARRTLDLTLEDGMRLRLRPVVPEDKARLVAGLERLSAASRYRRFMTAVARLPPRQLAYFTELDYVNHFALGALALDEEGEPGIAVARYVRIPGESDVAEVAVTVIDEFQCSGVGTLLLQALSAVAAENGIATFLAEIMGDNRAARSLVARFDARIVRPGSPLLFSFDAARPLETLRGTERYDRLRAMARGESLALP